EIFPERFDRVIRQPVVELVLGGFAGKDFEPSNFSLAAVSLLHRCVEDALAGSPDVRPGAVAANERNNGVIRHVEFAGLDGDFAALWWCNVFVSHVAIPGVRFTISNSNGAQSEAKER